ncbi:MAG: succinate dehydrogenase cytochrome b subunit [bacterium]|nr:succinate dehydrogenase cytochrome b subunit [bacterium]
MAATGLFLCLFLLVHLFGNLQLFLPRPQGQLQFNFYSHLLSSNPLIKIAGLATYAGILGHAVLSLLLTRRNRAARSVPYAYSRPQDASPWYARNMGILGTVLLIFLVIHMKTFWYEYHWGAVGVDSGGHRDLYAVVLAAFDREWYVALYVVAMAAMGYHLLHGVESAFRTFGFQPRRFARLAHRLGVAFAVGVSALFAIIPVYVYLVQRW